MITKDQERLLLDVIRRFAEATVDLAMDDFCSQDPDNEKDFEKELRKVGDELDQMVADLTEPEEA